MQLTRVVYHFTPDLVRPFWSVNRRHPKPDNPDQNPWAVQPAAHGRLSRIAYGRPVATFRTKKEAMADAKQRREVGPPDIEMVRPSGL